MNENFKINLEELTNQLGDLTDKNVTWGELMPLIFEVSNKTLDVAAEMDKSILKVTDAIADGTTKYYDEAEYRRMRSMAFCLAMMGYGDSTKWRPIYDKFCEDFDKLNRPKDKKENE